MYKCILNCHKQQRLTQSIARELKDLVRALESEVYLTHTDSPHDVKMGRLIGSVENHARSLGLELDGWCVYCAHTMGSERRKQLEDWRRTVGACKSFKSMSVDATQCHNCNESELAHA